MESHPIQPPDFLCMEHRGHPDAPSQNLMCTVVEVDGCVYMVYRVDGQSSLYAEQAYTRVWLQKALPSERTLYESKKLPASFVRVVA